MPFKNKINFSERILYINYILIRYPFLRFCIQAIAFSIIYTTFSPNIVYAATEQTSKPTIENFNELAKQINRNNLNSENQIRRVGEFVQDIQRQIIEQTESSIWEALFLWIGLSAFSFVAVNYGAAIFHNAQSIFFNIGKQILGEAAMLAQGSLVTAVQELRTTFINADPQTRQLILDGLTWILSHPEGDITIEAIHQIRANREFNESLQE